MGRKSNLNVIMAETYRRSLLGIALPYVILGIFLAGLFIWRVAVTDPDWDAIPDSIQISR